MNVQEIWKEFLSNIRETGFLEWLSTVSQIASVWYARKNNVLVYPTGIVGILIAAYLYLFVSHPPLYADGLLNFYYFAMSVYGWYNWVLKKDSGQYEFPVSWCNKKELRVGLAIFLGFAISLYFILKHGTNSNTPFLDSLVSSSAVTAMWWMAKRKIENWLAWILSNIVAIPLNFYKGFMLFTLMYFLFLILAGWGFLDWKKIIKQNNNG
ncbi:MAG: nicotinamide mononucleotide transporter [Chitinophagaceae bacterium]|nr:nicotinamide mononucleotide transporter [Bacteroidota bacterium]MCC6257871.1 nicotinamide mononucleotide transporter [Chitinophagaceae bacterium]MCW5916186.1 nicotinamide riboside transporter PnuC [Ferruginibacter sp.]